MILPLRYVLALTAVIAATAAVFLGSGRSIDRQQRDQRAEAMTQVGATLRGQVSSVDAIIRDASSFIATSPNVTAARFSRYAQSALRRSPVRGIGFVAEVPASARAAFERRIGGPVTEIGPRDTVRIAGRRSEYFAVEMVARKPGSAHGQSSIGLDVSSEPLRRAAMAEAAATRMPAATPPLRTLSGIWQPVLFDAVYGSTETLRGFIVASVDMHQLVQSAAKSFPGQAAVRVADGRRTVFSMPGNYKGAARSTVTVAGRRWAIEAAPATAMGTANDLRWTVALSGLVLVLLLLRLFLGAARQTEAAEHLVHRRTRELEERTSELDAALRDADTARAALSERNESLLELDRFKDRMLALISHDLRTPLTSIRGYVELLLDEETGPLHGEQERFLGVIKRNTDRLDRQIGDLLMVAKIAEGRLQLQRTSVDIARLVMEAAEAAGPQAVQKSIQLEAAARPLRPILADGPRLAQVLDNLVSNAIKYTDEGGRVDVRAWGEDEWVALSVSDTGAGMTADEQASIFEPFYRTDSAQEGGAKGTGLGLVIVKAIVEAHGGTVDVESTPGSGSRFVVKLPATVPTPWMPPNRLTTLEA